MRSRWRAAPDDQSCRRRSKSAARSSINPDVLGKRLDEIVPSCSRSHIGRSSMAQTLRRIRFATRCELAMYKGTRRLVSTSWPLSHGRRRRMAARTGEIVRLLSLRSGPDRRYRCAGNDVETLAEMNSHISFLKRSRLNRRACSRILCGSKRLSLASKRRTAWISDSEVCS